MRQFKDRVLDVLINLANVIETTDPNGLDVICTSDPRDIHHCRATENLVQIVQNNFEKGTSAPCFIETTFQTLVDKVIDELRCGAGEKQGPGFWIGHREARPISIYVLTSGVWDSSAPNKDGAVGTDRPINQLITELESRNLCKSQVAFHFIRFGDYSADIERVTDLSDCFISNPRPESSRMPALAYSNHTRKPTHARVASSDETVTINTDASRLPISGLVRFVNEFAEELGGMLQTNLATAELSRLASSLPPLLEAFAAKIGFCDTSSISKSLMYLVDRYRQ